MGPRPLCVWIQKVVRKLTGQLLMTCSDTALKLRLTVEGKVFFPASRSRILLQDKYWCIQGANKWLGQHICLDNCVLLGLLIERFYGTVVIRQDKGR